MHTFHRHIEWPFLVYKNKNYIVYKDIQDQTTIHYYRSLNSLSAREGEIGS